MSKTEYNPHLEGLEGSDMHHNLKNRPGEKGDADHAVSDAEPSDELVQAVQEADGDGPVAEALRKATDVED
ncbi:hypothetical protein [Dinoroseobacter sp. S375]|uniref:hypothetical protein n=1 Tax=Dinoroseobacter sp. S375 TaxID=3415136 RepID=UPI003C79A801